MIRNLNKYKDAPCYIYIYIYIILCCVLQLGKYEQYCRYAQYKCKIVRQKRITHNKSSANIFKFCPTCINYAQNVRKVMYFVLYTLYGSSEAAKSIDRKFINNRAYLILVYALAERDLWMMYCQKILEKGPQNLFMSWWYFVQNEK